MEMRQKQSRMSTSTLVTITVFLVLLSLKGSSSLKCFQCATTIEDDSCVTDYWGFVNDSKGITDTYIKDCQATNPEWDRCMIETLEQDGRITHFHRGCHDGKFFSTQFDSDRFKNLSAVNETTCARVVTLACYTFCQTDLCNGPQVPPNVTDPCEGWDYYYYDYNYVDLPDGVRCGAKSLHAVCCWLLVLFATFIGCGGTRERMEKFLFGPLFSP
ncbi:uncharacterized protein LOC101848001 [Aplysia californica]|uniref:Uncharacterized protein LOC101848001 n=1 Tax=Aplysia californica TaxID=6500 RepID=A0ABM0K7D1_APLCA|nr:uncharacterized protein LOC101848001 [Aplysia californica]